MLWYRLLLWLYPATFRAEYGAELCAVHAAEVQAAAGWPGRVRVRMAAIADVVRNALAVHADLLGQDLKYAARGLGRAWGFALTAILIMALGVGANTAVFSLADFVLLRPLAFPQPEQLVRAWGATPGYSKEELSPANYRDWQELNRTFVTLAAFNRNPANLVADGDPQRLEGARVTPDLLPLLGVQPLLGRWPAESRMEGEARTLVISYGLWQGRFAGAPDILDRRVNLDGLPHVIVGVMPPDFRFPTRAVQFWKPFEFTEADYADRTDNYLEMVGRLRAGVSREAAQADLERVAAQLEQRYPVDNEHLGALVQGLGGELPANSRMLLLALCGATLCTLLLACANLANLQLARSAAREHELAVRTALGAGRERIVRQMITESATLTLAGGSVGVLIALAALPLLTALVPDTLPIAQRPAIDLRVLGLAALFTILAGLGSGVLPALRLGGAASMRMLREGARTTVRGQRLRGLLVIVQVTACVVLVGTAGLLIRALWRVQQIDPGFRAENVVTLRTALPFPHYDAVATRDGFYRTVLTRLQAQPGISSAAYTSGLPMVMTGGIWQVEFNGQSREQRRTASLRFVTPGYFATLGIPLREGRNLRDSDGPGRPDVAVVSESFVQKYIPEGHPLGKRFQFAFEEREIVGVVSDVRVRGLERQSEPQVYLPHNQMRDGQSTWYAPKDLVIRTTLPPSALLPVVRAIVRSADPTQPISDVQSLSRIVSDQTGSRAMQLRIVGVLAFMAVLLAAIGIHGLLSFTVARRGREIGVRLALGAQRNSVLRMVLRDGLGLALAGLLPGLLLAYVAGRAMSSLLFGVQPADPPALLVATATAVTMTLLGSLLPALRAVSTDPLTVMRAD